MATLMARPRIVMMNFRSLGYRRGIVDPLRRRPQYLSAEESRNANASKRIAGGVFRLSPERGLHPLLAWHRQRLVERVVAGDQQFAEICAEFTRKIIGIAGCRDARRAGQDIRAAGPDEGRLLLAAHVPGFGLDRQGSHAKWNAGDDDV